MSIDDWRNEIDSIDAQLVALLNQRSNCAIEIGRIKRELGLPIYSPEREAQVVANVVRLNGGPLEAGAIRRLFERIIDESRSLERKVVARELAEKERGQGLQDQKKPSK